MDLNMIAQQETDLASLDAHVQVFKSLTHPARIAILNLLRDGEHCVCHLEVHLGFRQAYISQQIAVLRNAGLVQDRRDGWNVFYSVVDPTIFSVLDAAERFTGKPLALPSECAPECSCPHCQTSADAPSATP